MGDCVNAAAEPDGDVVSVSIEKEILTGDSVDREGMKMRWKIR
jgi:hypothetical protein